VIFTDPIDCTLDDGVLATGASKAQKMVRESIKRTSKGSASHFFSAEINAKLTFLALTHGRRHD
jgi:hypothetical protein